MAINDITGDALISRVPSQKYKDNFDLIFRNKNKQATDVPLSDDGDKSEEKPDCDGSQHAV